MCWGCVRQSVPRAIANLFRLYAKSLDKQKKGKARAKQFGKVEIPQEAFIGVLKINKEN